MLIMFMTCLVIDCKVCKINISFTETLKRILLLYGQWGKNYLSVYFNNIMLLEINLNNRISLQDNCGRIGRS